MSEECKCWRWGRGTDDDASERCGENGSSQAHEHYCVKHMDGNYMDHLEFILGTILISSSNLKLKKTPRMMLTGEICELNEISNPYS